ncbi:zinc finger protein [Anaeramoeba ignava]|uniref:Zinc finger protein n=1 Tax=Anaeramoeba ignava TaxID=1746090 RepID=A0A9Q0LRS8_ANAIG|nr:zinc finger protein [Anaeramoeba ignava]
MDYLEIKGILLNENEIIDKLSSDSYSKCPTPTQTPTNEEDTNFEEMESILNEPQPINVSKISKSTYSQITSKPKSKPKNRQIHDISQKVSSQKISMPKEEENYRDKFNQNQEEKYLKKKENFEENEIININQNQFENQFENENQNENEILMENEIVNQIQNEIVNQIQNEIENQIGNENENEIQNENEIVNQIQNEIEKQKKKKKKKKKKKNQNENENENEKEEEKKNSHSTRRRISTRSEKEYLRQFFIMNQKPNAEEIDEIVREIGWDKKRVVRWFANQNSRTPKQTLMKFQEIEIGRLQRDLSESRQQMIYRTNTHLTFLEWVGHSIHTLRMYNEQLAEILGLANPQQNTHVNPGVKDIAANTSALLEEFDRQLNDELSHTQSFFESVHFEQENEQTDNSNHFPKRARKTRKNSRKINF